MVHRQHAARRAAGRDNGVAVFEAERQRFFTHDALGAGLDRSLNDIAVQARMGGDADDIQLLPQKHLPVIQVEGVHIPHAPELLQMLVAPA